MRYFCLYQPHTQYGDGDNDDLMTTMMIMENLLSCALSVNPEPYGIDWDADHGGARHDVAERVRPPEDHKDHHHAHLRIIVTASSTALPVSSSKNAYHG